MLGLLPIVLVCILGLVQLVAVGYTFMETSHAAQAGARAWAVDDNKDWWTRAAKDELPKDWRDNAKVEALKGKDGVGVRVTVQVPSVLPVPASVARKLQIVEEKRTVAEE